MLPKTRLSAVTTLALLLALPSCSPPRDTSDASAADVGADSTQPSSDADISPDEGPSASTPTGPLAEHCGEFIGAPRIEELAPTVGGFLLTQVEHEGGMAGFSMELVEQAVEAAGTARVTAAGGITTVDDVAALDRLDVDALKIKSWRNRH